MSSPRKSALPLGNKYTSLERWGDEEDELPPVKTMSRAEAMERSEYRKAAEASQAAAQEFRHSEAFQRKSEKPLSSSRKDEKKDETTMPMRNRGQPSQLDQPWRDTHVPAVTDIDPPASGAGSDAARSKLERDIRAEIEAEYIKRYKELQELQQKLETAAERQKRKEASLTELERMLDSQMDARNIEQHVSESRLSAARIEAVDRYKASQAQQQRSLEERNKRLTKAEADLDAEKAKWHREQSQAATPEVQRNLEVSPPPAVMSKVREKQLRLEGAQRQHLISRKEGYLCGAMAMVRLRALDEGKLAFPDDPALAYLKDTSHSSYPGRIAKSVGETVGWYLALKSKDALHKDTRRIKTQWQYSDILDPRKVSSTDQYYKGCIFLSGLEEGLVTGQARGNI